MSTSVRAVLPFLHAGHGLFLHLGDKPFVRGETLRRMIESFAKGTHPIILPVFQGQKGHPALIDAIDTSMRCARLKGIRHSGLSLRSMVRIYSMWKETREYSLISIRNKILIF